MLFSPTLQRIYLESKREKELEAKQSSHLSKERANSIDSEEIQHNENVTSTTNLCHRPNATLAADVTKQHCSILNTTELQESETVEIAGNDCQIDQSPPVEVRLSEAIVARDPMTLRKSQIMTRITTKPREQVIIEDLPDDVYRLLSASYLRTLKRYYTGVVPVTESQCFAPQPIQSKLTTVSQHDNAFFLAPADPWVFEPARGLVDVVQLACPGEIWFARRKQPSLNMKAKVPIRTNSYEDILETLRIFHLRSDRMLVKLSLASGDEDFSQFMRLFVEANDGKQTFVSAADVTQLPVKSVNEPCSESDSDIDCLLTDHENLSPDGVANLMRTIEKMDLLSQAEAPRAPIVRRSVQAQPLSQNRARNFLSADEDDERIRSTDVTLGSLECNRD